MTSKSGIDLPLLRLLTRGKYVQSPRTKWQMDINAEFMPQHTNRYFLAINKPLEKRRKTLEK